MPGTFQPRTASRSQSRIPAASAARRRRTGSRCRTDTPSRGPTSGPDRNTALPHHCSVGPNRVRWRSMTTSALGLLLAAPTGRGAVRVPRAALTRPASVTKTRSSTATTSLHAHKTARSSRAIKSASSSSVSPLPQSRAQRVVLLNQHGAHGSGGERRRHAVLKRHAADRHDVRRQQRRAPNSGFSSRRTDADPTCRRSGAAHDRQRLSLGVHAVRDTLSVLPPRPRTQTAQWARY